MRVPRLPVEREEAKPMQLSFDLWETGDGLIRNVVDGHRRSGFITVYKVHGDTDRAVIRVMARLAREAGWSEHQVQRALRARCRLAARRGL